jgi:hypothetical protein
MGLPFLLAALIFHVNQTTWFAGENGVETALWWVGGVLMAITVIWFFIVLIAGAFSARSVRRNRW